MLVLGLSACAHQSKIQPSKGHIDGQNTVTPQSTKQSATDNAPISPATSSNIPKPVVNNTYLPPPKPQAKAQLYSIVVYDTPVKEVLFAIARDSKLNVDIHPSIQGRVTLNAVDQTLPAILERLSKQVDLTYKIQNNVLAIAPDLPVLRTYKIDYVNMSRDTKSFIGADGQISSASQSSGAGGTMSSTSGNGANNSSRTTVNSESKNHLWETLIENLKDLLKETDKEVQVSRRGSSAATQSKENTNNANAAAQAEASRAAKEERNQEDIEYKTLLAANVIANPETGVISVRATNKQHEKVQEFIDRVMGSAKRQVLIEATIVEVRLNDSFQAGIDWSRFGNTAQSSGFTFQQSLGPVINAASTGFAIGYLNPVSSLGNLAASVTLLKQFGDTKVISSPKLMVLNNQTAILKVVDNLVYFTVQAQQSQGTQGGVLSTITTTPNTVPVGIVMSVTPQINETSAVNINVRPTISRVVSFVRDPNPQLLNIASQIPQIQVREMESILQVNSGNTAILGGLMQDEVQRNSDKVPGLSDVPGVGEIFKGRDNANKKTELVIFLRPTVITNASLESDELSTYKQYLPSQQLNQTLDDER
ncbi:MAG: pilus (MSHA type) biogenesis protein MshL [Methylotenera sp.]|nr:pilus (MSHA type) biogenesis protein MshL [Methylotenera sp.]